MFNERPVEGRSYQRKGKPNMAATSGFTSFYWYDFETFGINSRADRPAQFAGLRTDMALNPLGGGEIFYAKPTLDYLPSPESCLLTGITPQHCEECGIVESDFAGKIWDRLNEPGTVSIGYNTLGFDDEVCRFLFWRNFLDPYAHSFGACARWDLFPLVCATWALRGSGIVWPQWEQIDPNVYPRAAGRTGVCFKLEFLTKANGIEHGHAHDALSDVRATIGLAQLIREKEPKLWDWAFKNRTTEAVEAAVDSGKPVVWVTPKFGIKNGCTRIVAALYGKGRDRIMWDLMHDPEELRTLSLEELRSRLFPSREARLNGVKPLPVQRLKTNSSPFVCSTLKVLSADRAARYGVDFSVVMANYQKFQEVAAIVRPILSILFDEKGSMSASDVDLDLYGGGFPSASDKALFRTIRKTSPQQLASMSAAGEVHFDDPRFNELLLRYRARNWPETLTTEELRTWQHFCQSRVLEGRPPFRTVAQYFEEIDRIGEHADIENEALQDLFNDLYEWGEKVGAACGE